MPIPEPNKAARLFATIIDRDEITRTITSWLSVMDSATSDKMKAVIRKELENAE